MHKLKDYTVISRKAQVWDEVTVFEATSEADAIEQAREEHYFHIATMQTEHIEFIRIARADEVDEYALSFLESRK